MKASNAARLIPQTQTATTFDQFWLFPNGRNRWPANSSKLKATKRWNAMTQRQRDRAVNYLPTYLHHLPNGVAMMYAETYLSRQLWNN